MKRVLLVDDDPVAVRIYRDGLARLGYEVSTATDGLAALKAMRAGLPDILVLDLMMPKLSGVEVLKIMRGQKEFETLPVIVLSNAYMDPMAMDAAKLGAQKGLLKVKCNPASLAAAIREVLEGGPAAGTIDHLLAASVDPPRPEPVLITPAPPPEPLPPRWPTRPEPPPVTDPGPDPKEQARQELSLHSQAISQSLGELFKGLREAHDDRDRKLRLENLYRKVHFVTALAGLAEYPAIAQFASAFEAMLFGIMDKLPALDPSLQRTAAAGLEYLDQLLRRPPPTPARPHATASALVVDDDRVSNRLVVSALRNAQLQARGTESPELALQWLQEKTFDIILLDIEMPGMDGIELCQRLRALPGYDKTPVIYVTLHSDFETRARAITSGGNDLISKPIVPTELAVKVVMHLLKSRLASQSPG